MMNSEHQTPLSIAERKNRLVAEGAAHRDAIAGAIRAVETGFPASLMKSAAAYLGAAGLGLFKGDSGLSRIGLSALFPLLVRGVSALSKKSLLKPVALGILMATATGLLVSIIIKKKNSRASPHATENKAANN